MHLYADYVTLVTLVWKESCYIIYKEKNNRKMLLTIVIILSVFFLINFYERQK